MSYTPTPQPDAYAGHFAALSMAGGNQAAEPLEPGFPYLVDSLFLKSLDDLDEEEDKDEDDDEVEDLDDDEEDEDEDEDDLDEDVDEDDEDDDEDDDEEEEEDEEGGVKPLKM